MFRLKTFARMLFVAIATAAVAPAVTVTTVPIPGLCNTGVTGTCSGGPGSGPLQTAGSADLNWQLATSSPLAAPPTTVAGLRMAKPMCL
jgi:hypothetical protein